MGGLQWDYLLKNLGSWSGSFTRLSPVGEIQSDAASLVTLEGLNDSQTIRQTIQQFGTSGELIYDRTLEYSSLSRNTLFFEEGAFSQGSTQFGPFSEFGAELGFIHGDHRLRLVQQFGKDSWLSQLTLIREHRQDIPQNTSWPERPTLTPEQLVGIWQGEAVTLYPDLRPPATFATQLTVSLEANQLTQQLSMPGLSLSSTAQINGSILRFEQGRHPMQLVLLPGGASANTPLSIPRGQAFLLEAGWLIQPDLRQRMIRSHDAKGEWVSLTLVTERRQISL